MKNTHHFAVIIFLILSLSCSEQDKKNNTLEIKNKIDSYLTKTMALHNIPGLALAVIEDDKVVYENYFGKSSLDDNTQLVKVQCLEYFLQQN